MSDQPWLEIPAEDYAAHMRAAGQDVALRELFAEVYAETRPARLAVLGCTTGEDLAQVDPRRTSLAVGVDINPVYLAAAAERLRELGSDLHLVHGDALSASLPPGPYDLVHAALLLEYVDPAPLFARVHEWLAPAGVFAVITQEPSTEQPAVSETGVASLRALAARMTLRTADEVAALAGPAGFALGERRVVRLPSGKRLVRSLFDKERATLGRRRGYARC